MMSVVLVLDIGTTGTQRTGTENTGVFMFVMCTGRKISKGKQSWLVINTTQHIRVNTEIHHMYPRTSEKHIWRKVGLDPKLTVYPKRYEI